MVTCTRLWNREGVGPKCIQAQRHCAVLKAKRIFRGQAQDIHQHLGLCAEVRTLPHSTVKLLNRMFFSCALTHANDKHFTAMRTKKRWSLSTLSKPKMHSSGVCHFSCQGGTRTWKASVILQEREEKGFCVPSPSQIIYILLLSPNYFIGYSICFFFKCLQ